ncbi:hypothetical protein OAU04_06645 [Alphaproteobacteria bacterium]|nr:hypothetical protein [Alphaproteobacteria bacterium]
MSVSSIFDANFYLTNNADVVVAISQGHFSNGLDHYNQFGGKELRAPNATFDPNYYAINNSDVLAAVSSGGIASVFAHFQAHGESESRAPSAAFASFDAAGYLAANADVATAITAGSFTSALDHYISFGQNESRDGSGITAVTNPGSTFALTAGIDSLTGTSNADTFNATADGNLSEDDTLNGGDGADSLIIRDLDNSTGAFTSSNIETIDVRFETTGQTLSLENVTGVTSVIYDASSSATNTISNALVSNALTLKNIGSGANATLNYDFVNGQFDGTNTFALKVDNVDDDMVLSLDASGTDEAIETLTIDVESASEGVIDMADEGLNAETVTITGAGELLIGAAGEGMTSGTVNAAGFTGNLTLVMGAEEMTVTGGSGSDTFDSEGTLTFEDTIVGGDGDDSVRITSISTDATAILSNTAASGNVANVSGVETLLLDGQHGEAKTIDMDQITGLTAIDLEGDAEGNKVTITDLANSSTIKVGLTAAHTDDIDFDLKANTSADTLTLDIETTSAIADINATNAFLNTLSIIADSNADLEDITGIAGATTLTLSGEGTLALGTLGTNHLSVDATAMEAALTVTTSASSTEVIGGEGGDSLTGGEGANILSGGAGTDTIVFEINTTNANTLTGGAGNDIFRTIDADAATFAAPTITDIDLGTSTTAADTLEVSLEGLDALTVLTDVVDSNGNSSANTNGTVVQFGTDAAVISNADLIVMGNADFADNAAMLTALETGGSNTITYGADLADNDGILIAYSDGTDSFIVVGANSAASAETSNIIDTLTTVVTLEGITTAGLANLDTTDFSFIA